MRYIASPVPIEQVDHSLGESDLTLIARTKQGYVYENPRALPRVLFAVGILYALSGPVMWAVQRLRKKPEAA